MGDNVSTGERVGRQIARWREKLRFSGRALGEAAGKSHSYIKKLEAGEIANPGLDTLDAIARVMGFDGLSALMAADPDQVVAPAPVAASNVAPAQSDWVDVVATATAGGSPSALLIDRVEVPASWTRGRRLIAARIIGKCMWPYLLPGDLAFFERVPDDRINNGDRVLITLLDHQEDGWHQVKYLEWGKNDDVILTAEDSTRLVEPYNRVKIEGRYWRMLRD